MNPVWFLNRAPQHILEEVATDEAYVARLREMRTELQVYLDKKNLL